MARQFKILDLSGYMFSGKAAVHDFIAEIDGFSMPGNRVEFDLLRVKDGFADLQHAVTRDWSPIRSDEAARRYLKVVRKMGRGERGLGRFFYPGFAYCTRYPDFITLSEKFIDDLTVAQWPMYWPYHLLDMSAIEIFLYKVKRKLFGLHNNLNYRLISGDRFYELAKDYLTKLLSHGVDESRYHTIVLNNAFELFNPDMFMNYFYDARCIVINRDPRDIYVAANQFSRGFNDQVKLYRNIAGAFDVNIFIDRIKTYRRQVSGFESPKVLRIDFEDIVLKYEETSSRIYSYLGIDPSKHTNKFKYFNPEKSKNNIGIWRKFGDQDAIRLIEQELALK